MSSRNTNNFFLPKAFLTNVKPVKKITEILIFWRLTITESAPFIIACLVLVSTISLHSPVLLFCMVTGSLIVTIIQRIGQQVNLPKHQLIPLQALAVAVLLGVFWLDYFAAPAEAQFFKKAEDFFQNTLTQGASNESNNTQLAVGLVFNVLRALYLLYIAVALIGVMNAVRKDEDWQSIARTPLLVVVAVTIADVLTGFIIGDTSP
jgi:hypothetical protein